MTIILVTLYSCNREEESLPGLQGSVSFGGISLDFEPMGSPGNRISGNSTWVNVFPNSAELIFTNKITRERHILKYNPNDLSKAASITLSFGNYEYYSAVDGGVFSAYLPFEARGEFSLKSKSFEIRLKANTDHGLVTVKNQMVEYASISDGKRDSELLVDKGTKYWFIYAKRGTKSTLKVKESLNGISINRDLDIDANKHFNFKLHLNESSGTALLMQVFKQEGDTESISKFFEENVTIKCPGAVPGEKGKVNNHTYEAVDRALLIKRRNEGADLSCVCTSLVTDMSWLFGSEDDVDFNQKIGNWDVSNVTNMSFMFYRVYSFNQPLKLWDVAKVTTMEGMFYNNSSFNQPIGNWDVSNVTNMSGMFMESAFRQPIGDWDVSNVTSMSSMFSYTPFNQPIGDWDVSNVRNMENMFGGSSFNQPIGNWDVGQVRSMWGMFYRTNFNQVIGDWDVRNVKEMNYMFQEAESFNQFIGDWDVRNVTGMAWMFHFATAFNQNLSQWCVQNIPNEPNFFSQGSALLDSNKPIWGTCPD
jgi:surface protein